MEVSGKRGGGIKGERGKAIPLSCNSALQPFSFFLTTPSLCSPCPLHRYHCHQQDRAHRIGQSATSVNVHYLVAPNTLDDILWSTLTRKVWKHFARAYVCVCVDIRPLSLCRRHRVLAFPSWSSTDHLASNVRLFSNEDLPMPIPPFLQHQVGVVSSALNGQRLRLVADKARAEDSLGRVYVMSGPGRGGN